MIQQTLELTDLERLMAELETELEVVDELGEFGDGAEPCCTSTHSC